MIDKIKSRYADFRRVWKRDGLISAIRVSLRYLKKNPSTLLLRDPTYQSDRIDHDQRWEMMADRIDSDAANALDVGCNRGAITRRAADHGLFSLGIDRKATIVNSARRRTDSPHCHYIQQNLSPKDIERFPEFDVGFLLAVYYHWTKLYGSNDGEKMLKDLCSRTDQLFLETPTDLSYIQSEKLGDTDDPQNALHEYFETVIPDSSVEFVGETDYKGGERTDLIFEITTS